MPESDEDNSRPLNLEAAREQEAEFFGTKAGVDYDLGGGEKWTLPNPSFMPRDMSRRHREHLRFLTNDLETVGKVNHLTGKKTPAFPLSYKGELIDEDDLLCIALMGTDAKADRDAYFKDGTLPETYQKFLNAGGLPGQIQSRWQMLNRQMQERLMQDPKSN